MKKLFPSTIALNEDSSPLRAAYIFVLKCVFAGSPWDKNYDLNNHLCRKFKETLMAFKMESNLGEMPTFGQQELDFLADVHNIDLQHLPNSLLRISTIAIDDKGDFSEWPTQDSTCLFPKYLDYSGAHPNCVTVSTGPIVLVYKCLFCFTKHWRRDSYNLNLIFDRGLAETVGSFQKSDEIDDDKCLGPATRGRLSKLLKRDLDDIPRLSIFL